MPIVKHSLMIQDPRDIPTAVHEAFHIARTGRPGPVLIDVPQDLSRADIDYEPTDDVHLPGYQPNTDGNAQQIRLAANALATSRRPDGWWQRIKGWQEKQPLRYDDSEDNEIKPQYMVEAMYEATNGDAIITSDVGQHQMWAAQWYHFTKPRRWLNSGGLGTMGVGLPFAIGAQVACPDETVVCLAGDGSLQMNSQEFATAVANDIPVKVFLMNNFFFGMVRQWQELFWDRRYSAVHQVLPDWVKLADAYGATGMRATDKTTLVEQMR